MPQPADLDAALVALSERGRAALLLCHLEGLTHREAADRLGCAEGTVASLVSRGMAKLRARFAGAEPAALAVAAPAAVTAATVRAAVSSQLAAATATPAALTLAREVLRMFWIRKATAAGIVAAVLVAAGFGAGLTLRHTPNTAAQEKPAVKNPLPPSMPPGAPYVVFTVRGHKQAKEIFTITEYTGGGKCRWSVIPAREQAEKWATTDKLIDFDQDALIGGARDYLTRLRKDAAAPRHLRLAIDESADVGGFTLEAMKICRDAGFEKVQLSGYVPNGGGFIPQLKIGPDGEAPGYKRYRGEEVDTKKLIADYELMLRTL